MRQHPALTRAGSCSMFWLVAFLAAATQMVGAEVVWQMGSETMQVAVSSDGSYVYLFGPPFLFCNS